MVVVLGQHYAHAILSHLQSVTVTTCTRHLPKRLFISVPLHPDPNRWEPLDAGKVGTLAVRYSNPSNNM